jgi:hypothetical protein
VCIYTKCEKVRSKVYERDARNRERGERRREKTKCKREREREERKSECLRVR